MDVTLLVGNIAIVCTIASNFAGLLICLDILKRRSTSGVSPLPFLTAAACTSLWLQYGIRIEDTVVTVVNLIAVFLQLCYLVCFHYATQEKRTIQRWLMSVGACLLSIHLYSFYIAGRETGTQALGLLASGSSILASAAPLAGLRDVFRTRTTKSLPFPIIFATFIVTILWYTYGTLVGDVFIKVPNLIGAILSGFQLSLFVIFDSKAPKVSLD